MSGLWDDLLAFFRGYPKSLRPVGETDADIILVSDEVEKPVPPDSLVIVLEILSEYADDVTREGEDLVYRTYDIERHFADWAREHGVETSIDVNWDIELVREARLRKVGDAYEVVLKYIVYLIKPKTVTPDEVMKALRGVEFSFEPKGRTY